MSTEMSCHFGHLLQVSNKKNGWMDELGFYVPSTVFQSFRDDIKKKKMFLKSDLGSLGDEILMSTGTSCHFGHFLQVLKKSLWCLILYNFFFFS